MKCRRHCFLCPTSTIIAYALFPVLGFGSVSTGWFMIKLQEVRDIEFEVARNELRPSMKDMAQQGLFAQCMQIVIRNQLLATTFTCGRSPRLFYFPEDMQGQIGKGKLSSKTTVSICLFADIAAFTVSGFSLLDIHVVNLLSLYSFQTLSLNFL